MKLQDKMILMANKAMLTVRKSAPEILTVVSLASGAAALGFTVKATMHLEEALEPVVKYRDMLAQKEQYEAEGHFVEYTEQQRREDQVLVVCKTAVNLAKLYAVPAAFAALSAASTLGMYKVWSKRYAGVVAAYTGLQGLFERYKDEISKRYGEDAKNETLARTLAAMQKEEEQVDEQTGRPLPAVQHGSEYARFFDESSRYWKRNAAENLVFLRRMQSMANDMLKIHGHLFLNEVYDLLDIPRTKAGAVVGWQLFDGDGDGYVDFGVYDMSDERKRAFVNGWEKVILLDFNVDGVIFDKI